MRIVLKIGIAVVALVAGALLYFRPGRAEVAVPADRGSVVIVENPDAVRASWRLVPLKDADVRIEWSAKVDALFDNGHACIRELITRTSANGEFTVPAWNARHGVSDVTWEAQLLEPGYRTYEEDQDPSMALPGYRHHLIVRVAADHPPLPDHRAMAGGEFACWEYPQSQ